MSSQVMLMFEQDSTGDQKTEEVEEETVTEAVSQLQLEQSKEFDPLEQSQVQVSDRRSAVLRSNGPPF